MLPSEEGPSAEPPRAKSSQAYHQRNLPHFQTEGKSYFVTFRTRVGRDLPERARDLVLQHCLHDHGRRYWMHGLVVMPDHVHLVLTPMPDPEGNMYGLEEILGAIKGASAHSVNKLLAVHGHLWLDESFDHILRSDESRALKVSYVCQNPVRKRLVVTEDDYPWLWREWVEGDL